VTSLQLSVPGIAVTVDPDSGGRISRVEVDGHSLLLDAAGPVGDLTPTGWGSFPMAPFAGRVRRARFSVDGTEHTLETRNGHHAMHGTVLDRPWVVTAHTATTCSLRTDLSPAWPWDGWCEQHLDLSPGCLSLRLAVHTRGEKFPASAGWHPWFRTRLDSGESLSLEVDAAEMAERDPEHIPTGDWSPLAPRPWDDCLRDVSWPARLRWGRDGQITVGIDITADTRYCVVFDEPDHAWCVEPQSAPPDALGRTADVVTPGRPLIVTCEWRWIRPDAPILVG
jgi:galactose mutarotase-like enzyme